MWNACTMKPALSMPCIYRNDVHLICEIHSPVYSERNPTFSSKRQISLWFPKSLTNDLVWWYIQYLKCCLLYEVLLQSRIKYYGYFVSNMKYKLLHKQKIAMVTFRWTDHLFTISPTTECWRKYKMIVHSPLLFIDMLMVCCGFYW